MTYCLLHADGGNKLKKKSNKMAKVSSKFGLTLSYKEQKILISFLIFTTFKSLDILCTNEREHFLHSQNMHTYYTKWQKKIVYQITHKLKNIT